MNVELRPLGITCNIKCRYCYQGRQRSSNNIKMHYDMQQMKLSVEKQGGPFILFGGEPLLIPLDDLEELFQWGFDKYGRNGLQTNGILITDLHIQMFEKYNVVVGISIDGPGELNNLRWQDNLQQTLNNTKKTIANIKELCRKYKPPGLIITLHRFNASDNRLSRLHEWMREMDELGICSVRLHIMEVETEKVRNRYALSDEENIMALLSFVRLQPFLKNIRFDIFEEIECLLTGDDSRVSCVWHACDQYNTGAVNGIEGYGESSNCGRTNKDGIDYLKSSSHGFERYISLYSTPQVDGGCQDCRFFIVCKGQCPGTAIGGDWRNRSENCNIWKNLFLFFEEKLVNLNKKIITIHPLKYKLESLLLRQWKKGNNAPISLLIREFMSKGPASYEGAKGNVELPNFVRHSYSSKHNMELWALRIENVRKALVKLAVLSVAKEITESTIIRINQNEVIDVHNHAVGNGLHTFVLPSLIRLKIITLDHLTSGIASLANSSDGENRTSRKHYF